MSASKKILNVEKPNTQSVKAVCALLAWKGRSSNPLPSYVELGEGDSRLVLVLSNKKDAYYTVTAKECSCPAHNWHPGQRCKHQRAHFPQEQSAKPATVRQPNAGRWHGHNGPVLDEERPARVVAAEVAATSPSFEMVDTTPDANNREIAYHEMAIDREMWPCEVA